MLLMLGLPIVFIPLVGLAFDGTKLYIVQAKLSEAVDGAALGSGRLLGTVANTTEIAGEFLSLDAKIDNIRVAPNEWMEGLDVGDCRTIFFTPVNFYGTSLAQLDGNNARRRIGAEEQAVAT